MRTLLIFALTLAPSVAFAQALPNINLLSVRYNSQRTAAKPEGELKIQIDEVDKAIADARRAGNAAEIRRQIAKGLALLNKETWTPSLDYRHSLVVRSERSVVDSSMPYAFRIEQIYRPAIELTPALSTKVAIRKRSAPAAPSRDLGTFDGMSRDLRESPFAIEVDLTGIEDGSYTLATEVFDGTTSLGSATLNVVLHKGLD